ncbi:hypothetical protein AYO44_09345 [Planctomycetaceae bacterium SCGC AG-212-F19]|nr:hypothetical protein AYO44_09345 [Planctomycetaceae bacterium SCGC AG-212-F19]
MKSLAKLYEFHVANHRAIESALDRVALTLRDSLSREDQKNVDTFTRLYALLLGAWAESRLAKLLYEPNAFTIDERNAVQQQPSHLDRWNKVIELAVRKHYGIPRARLSPHSLPHSAYSRYQTLLDLLSHDLKSVITLRNKLAHGQWAYPLNEAGDDVAQEQFDALRNENVLSLQLKRRLLDYLLHAVQDLALSRPAFERDFDAHYRGIQQTRQTLLKRPYASYVQAMKAKFKRGQAKRNTTP